MDTIQAWLPELTARGFCWNKVFSRQHACNGGNWHIQIMEKMLVLTTLSPYRQSSVNQQIVARSQAHYSICANNKDTLAIDGWPVIFNTM